MRYLAIDYGVKRTGLAVCDAAETMASPLAVIEGQGQLVARIAETVRAEKIEGIVLGLPLNMDDTESSQTKRVRDFGRKLEEVVDVPVFFQDERLSSFEAEQKLIGADYTRKKKKKRLDAIAAAGILEAFLEAKGCGEEPVL